MTTVTVEQARSQLDDLLEAARAGEEIVIADDNRPGVKLVPVDVPPPNRKAGSAKGKIIMADDFDEPLEDFEEYMP